MGKQPSQGGLHVHREAMAEDRVVTAVDLQGGAILLHAGKKR